MARFISGNIHRMAKRSKRLALMHKVAIPLAVYLLSGFPSRMEGQAAKPHKHAMPMPGMQMAHENRTAVASLRIGLVKAWNAADPPGLAGLFSESAVVILPNGKLVTGKQSILEFFQRKVTNTRVTLTSIGFEISPELQVDFGIFSESSASASGENRSSNLQQNDSIEGKYLMVAKHVGTDWKIQEFVFVVPARSF